MGWSGYDGGSIPHGCICVISYGESALQVSEPLCKYRLSEGREKISERDNAHFPIKRLPLVGGRTPRETATIGGVAAVCKTVPMW